MMGGQNDPTELLRWYNLTSLFKVEVLVVDEIQKHGDE
jgi:hypothetical protein